MTPSPFRHEPPAYRCPFCNMNRGIFHGINAAEDIVAQRDLAFAFIAPKWWPANHGAALVVPRAHHENLYELPADVGHAVWDLTQEVARAMRTSYDCQGISTRQHNEPAGNQDVWHLHVHVFPRQLGDGFSATVRPPWSRPKPAPPTPPHCARPSPTPPPRSRAGTLLLPWRHDHG